MPTSFVELLYRTSLEHVGHWFMIFGTGLESEPPYLNIGVLDAFACGYRAAQESTVRVEDDAFFKWLRDEANAFPGEGWARHFLAIAEGDHEKAIRLFFVQVHAFALARRPEWFIRFNREPQPSRIRNGFGTPYAADVRLPEHIEAATMLNPGGLPRRS